MKIDIDVKMSFDLKKINLDLHRELNTAGLIIRRDHYQRLQKGKGVDGSQMRPLSPNTVAAKRASKDSRVSGNANKTLVSTGQMRNLVIEKATKSSQTVEVHPGRIRKYKGTKVTMTDVGEFHQEGTGPYVIKPRNKKILRFQTKGGEVFTKKVNHPGLPQREWFGITLDAESRILQSIEDKIERQLIRA